MDDFSWNWDIVELENPEDQKLYMRVYGLEVEDFKTYFVGNHGVWGHDSTFNKVSDILG